MSNTRFYNDSVRIQNQLDVLTYAGRYALNVPGPGDKIPFMEDVHVRLQRDGGNVRSQFWDIENELRCATQHLSHAPRAVEGLGLTKDSHTNTTQINHDPFVEESRTSHPSWTYRGIDHAYSRWEHPWLNPQALHRIEKPFLNNVASKRKWNHGSL